MGMALASGKVFPQDFLKTPRRQHRKPPCPSPRQVPGEGACLPKEERPLGRKLERVHSRPRVGLSLHSCYAKMF